MSRHKLLLCGIIMITVVQSLCRESECEEPELLSTTTTKESNTTTTITHSPTSRHVTTMTTTASPSIDREEPADSGILELITIVVPAVGGAVLLGVCLLVVVVIVCCSCLCRIKKRRRKSLQIGKIKCTTTQFSAGSCSLAVISVHAVSAILLLRLKHTLIKLCFKNMQRVKNPKHKVCLNRFA